MQNPNVFKSGEKTLNSVSYYDKITSNAIPKHYLEEDFTLSGYEDDPIDRLLRSHLIFANNVTSVININVNSLTGTSYSSLNTVSGIAPYFVIQNNLTEITPDLFEKKLLIPLNKSYKDFSTSADFHSYVTGTFIPGTVLNTPTLSFPTNSHLYLIQNLSWLYFLNTSGNGGYSFNPSSLVANLISDKLYRGNTIHLDDCLKAYEEFIWKNYTTCSTWQTLGLIPNSYFSSTGEYTSGTQSLENLKTLTEILYSPLFIDRKNFKVKNAFEEYLSSESFDAAQTLAAPFSRLLKAFSYSFANINSDVDQLSVLYDLQECPDHLLPELANLIGWRLFGFNADRWRLQLYNAVSIYKRAGTKASIQLAVNTLFSDDIFNISGSIYELWESYIPNIAIYALATDSSAFESFDSWTPTLARKLGVNSYSTTSLEENIRLATDTIILDLVNKFPDHFKIAGKPFPIDSSGFRFNYRNRIYPIPPFEEYPYYVNSDLSIPLIDRFVDNLVCFGISNSFAIQIRNYLISNSINASNDLQSGNGWLLFTSSLQIPPNWDSIISKLSIKNTNLLDLWNVKSSHFKVILESSDFDFTKSTFDADSYHAVRETSRVINEFSPAHSIPDIRINANATDIFTGSDFRATHINLESVDGIFSKGVDSSSRAFTNSELSAVNTRGLYPSATFSRSFADHVEDAPFSGGNVSYVYRNAVRRRNFRFALDTANYYSRTGFNMPVSMEASTLERSMPSSLGFIPLGFIPSSLKYQSISDYKNLPDVYSYCQNRSSSSVIAGVAISATFPCRGLSALTVSDYYVDRGNCPELIQVYHKLKEKEKEILAEKTLDAQLSALKSDSKWKYIFRSYANSATEALASEFPSSFNDYESMGFGRGIHTLYNIFIRDFVGHTLNGEMTFKNGPNIFAHTFGSILRNSNFDKITSSYSALESSSISNITYLTRNNLFVNGVSGTTVAQHASSLVVSSTSNYPQKELRNSNIYSGVELIMPSSVDLNNYFAFIKLSNEFDNQEDLHYFVDNTMLLINAKNGMLRAKWSIKDTLYSTNEGYGVTRNFLLPENDFELKIKNLITNNAGDRFGGLTLGVWIHTSAEGNHFWSFNSNSEWILCDATKVTQSNVIGWSHIFSFPERDLVGGPGLSGSSNFKCLELLTIDGRKVPLANISERDFSEIKINFHTKNKNQILPSSYKKNFGQLHKKSQDYVIELFILPTNQDKILFVDNVNLVDLTLQDLSRFKVNWGTLINKPFATYCPQRYVELTREDILCVFLNFREISTVLGRSENPATGIIGPLASPSPNTIYTNIFGTSGGSRLNFRISPSWVSPVGAGNLTSSINIVN